jgi:hypothetical protein
VFNSEILRSPRVILNVDHSEEENHWISQVVRRSVFGEIHWRLRGEEITEVPKLQEAVVDSRQFESFEMCR